MMGSQPPAWAFYFTRVLDRKALLKGSTVLIQLAFIRGLSDALAHRIELLSYVRILEDQCS